MVAEIIEDVRVPTPTEAWEEWRERLSPVLSAGRIAEVQYLLTDLYGAGKALAAGQIAASEAQTEIHRSYDNLRAILASTPLGEAGPWPEAFWSSTMGRLIYYCFEASYGFNLLSVGEAAHHLGLSVTRVGALQREMKADYLIDPDAKHPHRARRKMTWVMLERTRAHLKQHGEDGN